MDREHFRQIIKAADEDLKVISQKVQEARDRLAAADVKYRERMTSIKNLHPRPTVRP